jgi:hypothetical protein
MLLQRIFSINLNSDRGSGICTFKFRLFSSGRGSGSGSDVHWIMAMPSLGATCKLNECAIDFRNHKLDACLTNFC